MTKLTLSEYKNLTNKGNAIPLGDVDISESRTVKLLKEMGRYFEIDSKKVLFFIKQMKLSGKLSIIAITLILFSCSSHDFGYQNHPLPKAYYPKRVNIHLGPITLLDLQTINRRQ